MVKPRKSLLQVWNMCFGFLGIQIGFGLQNANASRIFQTLGADFGQLPMLWIAAPVTGLLIQPLIGHFSDRTWGPLGRRRPYFLFGALLTTLAMFTMPIAPALLVAAGALWIMDASINITMEPFRAFVGDLLPEEQRTTGFAMQSFFIGVGAVFASALPWMLSNWFHVANTAPAGVTPESVRLAFWIGGACLLAAVWWTVFTTREYSPEQAAAFETAEASATAPDARQAPHAGVYVLCGVLAILLGAAATAGIHQLKLEKELYILTGAVAAFGLVLLLAAAFRRGAEAGAGLFEIVDDLFRMPTTMKQLAVVQFFSWFGLFAMWIWTTPAVATWHYGTADTTSLAYNTAADWVGVLFAVYNGVAALAAFLLPVLARRVGRRAAHAICLGLGAAGLASFAAIKDPQQLWLGMVGIGFAWASVLSVPYSILSGALPSAKMGVYMGIFNFFIVIPQLVAATLLGLLLRHFFGGQPIWGLVLGAGSMILAALFTFAVRDVKGAARRGAAALEAVSAT